VGRVRQDAFLFETLTVRESLTFTAALRLREKTPAERKRRVEEGEPACKSLPRVGTGV
jgi:ABC-type multidrug transport system ATPase subunit